MMAADYWDGESRMGNQTAVIIISFLLWSGAPAWAGERSPVRQVAEEPSTVSQIGTKLLRGAANFATGWVEFPKQIYLVGQNEGWLTGAIRGPIDGLGWFVARTVGGAYEVLTFPFPIPFHYQPLFTPEYVWQPVPPEPVSPTSSLFPADSSLPAESKAKSPTLPSSRN
ncbi:MAG: exosortase system-associated protein, TIGR04073 family [Nitrospira sp.]|nr:exosortase system-associated protein, TIGR04073 family [Nitrospira sp.]